MEKKFKLTNETIDINHTTLYRIEALRDFGIIKCGSLGGFVESEDNLSHDGLCWVYDDARVFGNAKVSGDVRVYDNAMVYGNALCYDNADIRGKSRIYGKAQVYGNALCYDNADIRGKARVFGQAYIGNNVTVYGNAIICGVVNIYTNGNRRCDGIYINGDANIVNMVSYNDFCNAKTK